MTLESKIIDIESLISMTPNQRRIEIISHTRNFNKLNEIDQARELARVINTFIMDYINLHVDRDFSSSSGSILTIKNLKIAFDKEIDDFKPELIKELKNAMHTKQELLQSPKNIYDMSGATKLSLANNVTRQLSTKLGYLWEKLAAISPYAISPEIEFDLKIKGIDLISLNIDSDDIEYQQLKTQRNTLTGSQKGRSEEELMIHSNPVFCACFLNKSAWTFKHEYIPRVAGEDFWHRIGISYDVLLQSAQELILEVEDEYIKMLTR